MAQVDLSTNTLKKVEAYITAGMEMAIDTALDFVENKKDSSGDKVNEVSDTMLQYVKMETELKQFLEAVQYVRDQAKNMTDPSLNLVAMLDDKLSELQKDNDSSDLRKHEKYVELQQKIQEVANPDEEQNMPGPSAPLDVDEDLAISQAETSTKCPYTGQEMKHPMRNKHCGHNYDRDGIKDLLHHRGNRAKCPVGGCPNDKPIEMSHLEENKELKRFIDRKVRLAGKRTKKGPPATVLSP
jgi:SUMO ligase MMS21 Smc5/6 complex component